MEAEPLLRWSEPITELFGFILLFLSVGAVGFRWVVLRGLIRPVGAGADPGSEPAIYQYAANRAAWIGLLAVLAASVRLALRYPALAVRRHTTVSGLLLHNAQAGLQAVLVLAALVGFVLAIRHSGIGWVLAGIGVLGERLEGLFFGQFSRLVNPIHATAGALWIGTLFFIVVVGLPAVLRSTLPGERRGRMVADLISAFSPFALAFAAILVTFGVITAWRHLHKLSALWTTPYGYALIAKLCLVGMVVALGAWNWKRQRPNLGSEPAAHAIRRSASAELTVAFLVLIATSILVSLPSPREGREGGPRPPGAQGAPPSQFEGGPPQPAPAPRP